MLVNTAWLLDYLDPKCSHAELLHTFTAAGLEVEEEHHLAEELRKVVIGFIRDKQPIADAPGLFHTKIEIAPGRVIDVVCASEHDVQTGWGVPVAPAGTVLPSGVEIKPVNLHGVPSEGMICLDGEMGLVARSTGLQVFEDESLLGQPLPEVTDVSELLVDLAILPNRPDCLGMIGIAREMAALLSLTLNYPVEPERHLALAAESVVPVHIEDGNLCCRYLGQVIRRVRVGPSPHWLKSRLLCAGKRPINNVVDVTNFVLLEWGQPLHAFDLSTLRGGEIHVRKMKDDESLTLLDDTIIKADTESQPLIIADAERPVALAGIMGGRDTQTTAETTDVLLEAACFDAVNIRNTSKRLDVRSDSSYRFERGTDPNRMLTGAATRATELIVQFAGGELDGACTEQYPIRREPRSFTLSTEQFSRYLGMPVDARIIRTNLQKLQMQCTEDLHIEVPTWRTDCTDPVALIEDVARLVGYDAIPLKQTGAPATSGTTRPLDHLRRQLAHSLTANGFLECRTPPLVGTEQDDPFTTNGSSAAKPIRLQNPMRTDMVELRRSLIPSLLEVVERNARRGADSFRFYEIDRTFCIGDNEPVETWTLGLIVGGPVTDLSWQREKESIGLFHLKGIVENLLEEAGLTGCQFAPTDRPGLVAGQTAAVSAEGQEVGILGTVAESQLSGSKLRTPLFAAELILPRLLAHYEEVQAFRGLPRTPAVQRDFAVILPVDVRYSDIEQTARDAFSTAAQRIQQRHLASETSSGNEQTGNSAKSPATGARLEQVRCIDHYRGKPIPANRKSLALRLTFRDPRRTLTSEESNELLQAVIDAVTEKHNAELRG